MIQGLSGMIGGGLGLLAGATSSAGYKGKEFGNWLTDSGQEKKHASQGLGFLSNAMTGRDPMMSQGAINQLLSGQDSRLEATAKAGRARAQERAIGRGEVGNKGGMLEASLAGLDRSLLDAKRQQAAPLYGQLAMQAPSYRMQAAGMMLPFLQGQQGARMGEHNRMEDLRGARAAAGSTLHRALAGGAAGFAGAGGMQGFSPAMGMQQASGGYQTYNNNMPNFAGPYIPADG